MKITLALVVVLTLCPLTSSALVQPASSVSPSRGALLYETHCIACHSTQIHWRNKKAATDWSSLKAEVRRWQGNAKLSWTDADIEEVARHLNDTVYRFTRQTAAHPARHS